MGEGRGETTEKKREEKNRALWKIARAQRHLLRYILAERRMGEANKERKLV